MHDLGPWVCPGFFFFSSNSSLLSCILLSCFPLLNVTSPSLLFWMNDQKKIIFQRVMIVSLLDDCLLAAGDPAPAGVTSPLPGCHAISLTYIPFTSGWEVGLGNGGWAACPEESDCVLFCSASFGKSSDPTSPYISANRNSSPATSPITIGSSTSRGNQWQPASCPAPVSTNTTASVQHAR